MEFDTDFVKEMMLILITELEQNSGHIKGIFDGTCSRFPSVKRFVLHFELKIMLLLTKTQPLRAQK